MTYRISPAIPRVWRSPHSLQYGIDTPLAVLDRVGIGHERMLELLTVGTPRNGLHAIGSEYGMTTREINEFIETLTPVFESASAAARRPRPRITLVGDSLTADVLAHHLESGRVAVTRINALSAMETTPTDLGIAVAHYVLEPELHGAWLRRDIPHLPIVLGDREARVGPLITPGLGPCLYCLERFRSDADPAWSAIASQLWGRSSPIENPFLATEVSVLATGIALENWAAPTDHTEQPTHDATLIDANGRRRRERHEPHPECGCRGWGELITLPTARAEQRPAEARPARARSGTATARAARAARSGTRSRAGADGHG